MLYRNIKSGAIVSVETPVCGDWEPVQKKQQAPVAAPEIEKKAPAKKKKSVKKTAR